MLRTTRSRRTLLATAVLTSAALLAACGSSGGSAGTTSAGTGAASAPASGSAGGSVTTLHVGVIAIVDVAPLYIGIKQGFFADENLKVVPEVQAGGSLITTSVISGKQQIGFSNVTSLVIAASKGLPVQIIAAGDAAAKDPSQGFDGVLVPADSPIKTAKDLEGKKVSVNGIQNVGGLTINTALANSGVDYKKITYSEVQFPAALAALKQGQVDAAFVVEPFLSQGLAQGDRVILHPFEQTAPSYTVATYFTTGKYAQAHPDVVKRFVTAINKSLTYAQQNPQAVRDILPTYTKVPATVAAKIHLPQFTPDLNKPTIELTATLAQKYGYIKKQPDLSTLLK